MRVYLLRLLLAVRRRMWMPAFALSVLVQPAKVAAQDTEVVRPIPTCGNCSIQLRRVLRVGSAQDSIYYFLDRLDVARDRHGLFYIGPRWPSRSGEFAIDVYDSQGRRVRSIVKEGLGPGEVSRVYGFLLGPADTLTAFGESRASVLTTSGSFIRNLSRIPGRVHSAVLLPSGEIFAASPVVVGDRVLTHHVVSRDSGTIVLSFGAIDARDRQSEYGNRRTVAPSERGDRWSARVNRYEIELWDEHGRRQRTIVREPEWFRPWTEDYAPERGPGKLQPHLVGTAVDRDGRLWVCVYVPKDRSVQTPSGIPNASAPGFFGSIYDTVIEVIDLDKRQLVTSERFSGAVRGFFPGRLMAAEKVESDGVPYLEVFQVSLVRP